MSVALLFLAPLVSLALKVTSLVGIDQAPTDLALVASVGALVAMFCNPFFGKLGDRTSAPLGMRRPWLAISPVCGSVGILIVALAPRSAWSWESVSDRCGGRHLPGQVFTSNQLAMFLFPCVR